MQKKNKEDLYNKILSVYEMPQDVRKTMGINGRKKMEREFDRNIVIRAYLERLAK